MVIPIPGCDGFQMHVGQNVTNTVVFIGIRDSAKMSGCRFFGTGFLLSYKNIGYLITARHVVDPIEDCPFVIRANRSGESKSDIVDADNVNWFYPNDKTVDLAAIELSLTGALGYGAKYLPEYMLVTDINKTRPTFDVGDLCYTVGMFHFVSGAFRNLPLVYTGNIALMAPEHETIPVGKKNPDRVEYVEAYLIETKAIDGASGSPVFIRPSFSVRDLPPPFPAPDAIIAQDTFSLLGIFTGAWFLPPDAILKEEIRARETDKVPVGLGVVVPAYKLIELLESEPAKKKRDLHNKQFAAEQTSLPSEPPVKNPLHKENFTALLNAAVRKREPKR